MPIDYEPAQVAPGVRIVAKCMDCGKVFSGEVGVRFIETPEGQGVEIGICPGSEFHAVTRIERGLIPTVKVENVRRRICANAYEVS